MLYAVLCLEVLKKYAIVNERLKKLSDDYEYSDKLQYLKAIAQNL